MSADAPPITHADDLAIVRDEMQYRAATFIETYTGRAFWPLKPTKDALSIIDIAHALSNQCRYSGHVRFFYSVAQHCCLLAAWLAHNNGSALDCLRILMHDAAEAYLVDIPRPVKQYMPQYRVWDHAIGDVINDWMGWADLAPLPIIDELDNRIIVDERRELMSASGLDWGHHHGPIGVQIDPWTPAEAEKQFLRQYELFSRAVYGSPQYVNYAWGSRASINFETQTADQPFNMDVVEVDVRGCVGRVIMHDEYGRPIMSKRTGAPVWAWRHGKYEIRELAA
jgi:hypothetical protein